MDCTERTAPVVSHRPWTDRPYGRLPPERTDVVPSSASAPPRSRKKPSKKVLQSATHVAVYGYQMAPRRAGRFVTALDGYFFGAAFDRDFQSTSIPAASSSDARSIFQAPALSSGV